MWSWCRFVVFVIIGMCIVSGYRLVMESSFSSEPLPPNKLKLAEESIGLFILVIDFAIGISSCGR
jgi:hypothetical protein